MFDYVELIWGLILTVISSMVLGYFFGALGSFAGFLIVTTYVGYNVNEDMLNSVFYGSLVALLAGIISFMIMLVMWGFGLGPVSTIMEFGVVGIILGLLVDLIIGASGGAIGSIIRQ
jgi:hypothetical protein